MNIYQNNNVLEIFDKHFSLKCPHCDAYSNITAVSIPQHEIVKRFKLIKVGIVYRCDACNEPIFLKFNRGTIFDNKISISENYEEI